MQHNGLPDENNPAFKADKYQNLDVIDVTNSMSWIEMDWL